MQDYIAVATGPDGQPLVLLGGGNELQHVRGLAERHVVEHPDEQAAVYNKTGQVAIVCAPKWQ